MPAKTAAKKSASAVLPTLLIADDEKNTREGLRRALEKQFRIHLAVDAKEALEILKSQPIDVLLTDLRLGKDNGLELLARARQLPQPPVCLLMTAYSSVETAVEAMRQGAYDYLTKPLNLDEAELLLLRAWRSRTVEAENESLRQQLDSKYGLEKIIGSTAVMQAIFTKIRQVADTRATVLITGESGTGKELVAHALHRLSSRRSAPFVAVHCAALAPQLLESELFGHEKGAFTGALERRVGRFEQADGGTLFLDEIGEIDAATQVKLLRALGERVVQRVGGQADILVDVRVVAATNRDLEALVAAGKFREDLFFRLNVVRLHLPPLRERKEDLPLFIRTFVEELALENKKNLTGLAPDARAALLAYDWPGNVRELRGAIEHGVALAQGTVITAADLPERVLRPSSASSTPRLSTQSSPALPPGETLNLEEMEKRAIIAALRAADGSRHRAAEILGIHRRTLLRKLQQYKIEA